MNDNPVNTLGNALEARIVSELEARPLQEFDALLDLRNLAGQSTGYVRAFSGGRLAKGTSVSIAMMPGMRYFNIHLIPDPHYDIPRFLFEGMLMTAGPGSQVSMDLFPDVDDVEHIDELLARFAAVGRIYDEARKDPRFRLEPSRQMHMRAFASPVFLLVFGVPAEQLPALEGYAGRYFDAWLDLYRNARRLSDAEAEARTRRRRHIGDTIMRLDPDRHMVVSVYGEETTRMIERANYY
jgi:hypothetical protein